MEEEVGIKVTRLRRRLSVEAEDVKSPSTPSTPTKKRGGRLAAKPQLELIDENATEIEKPKRTRKSAARDAETEEKVSTPSRRSTRIKSNTSIVSETAVEAEDKGTPSRRSTRIKSNTSIVAETVQYSDSPRAKRAARRTSQIGSDNEAPITPARQTRRTRKDSTSSIDKQVDDVAGKLVTQVKEIIVEETDPDTIVKETENKETPVKDKSLSLTTRKSPRLVDKTGRSSSDNDNKENEPQSAKKTDTTDSSLIATTQATHEINLSVSTTNLINELDSKPKTGNTNLNKTTSAINETQLKSKRHRTKSWTTICSPSPNDNNFLSDNETMKKKNKRQSSVHNLSNISGSGDNLLNTSQKSVQENMVQDDFKQASFNTSLTSNKKKKKISDKSILDTEVSSQINTSTKVRKSMEEVNESSTKINDDLKSEQKEDSNFAEKYFSAAPTGTVQSFVFIEDSDSNTDSIEKEKENKEFDSEDQCVPVVKHKLVDEISKETKNNLSYEPMDVDETMPENMLVFSEKNISVTEVEKNAELETKSFINVSEIKNISIDNIPNKSQRKSNILQIEDDNESALNKSKRISSVATLSSEDDLDKSSKKSKRKSSMSTMDIETKVNNQPPSISESISKSINKSTRKSVSNTAGNDDKDISSSNFDAEGDNSINKSLNKSKGNRKSAIDNADLNINNKFKKEPSILNIDNNDDNSSNSNDNNVINMNDSPTKSENADVTTKSANKSKRKSTISDVDNDSKLSNADNSTKKSSKLSEGYNEEMDISFNNPDHDDTLNKSSNKSKRKSSIKEVDNNNSAPNPAEKSIISKILDTDEVDSIQVNNHDEQVNKLSNNSKRKSSISNTASDCNNLNKSGRKSTARNIGESNNKGSDQSKRKTSISSADVEFNRSSDKSKRKSSESQYFDKSTNENKSTLVLSQLKDASDANVQKDLNESNDMVEQLSKSVNVPNITKDEGIDKKNLSLTYSTSTPLQQKSTKKLGMQINSSIIAAPNSVTKIDSKASLNKSKKETSILSQNDEESEPSDEDEHSDEEVDEEEEDSDEESVRKSNMIDNEADEASDDYESGDSRDSDEREYEEQNEIVEKGETLDSEDEDYSDDSDYEKGSFIVDSDEEDNDLLSGSGDDLSMSADELNMGAKSKKKFNERKIKEQKKASREMFEARHKLNESEQSDKAIKSKSKKINRQRLESSESEEEICVKPNKKGRARIDSSQEISMIQSDLDKSTSKKKKKIKRLSNSVCEDSATNEKEISIQKSNETEIGDPLSLQNTVKQEPKTPQKDLNISTVAITNIEEVEKIEVDENVSVIKTNQTSDPLQTTMAQDESMGDDSEESISENEEISQNYESVLNDLNKKSKNVKSLDISLNLNKKTKQKAKEPIVDELNLTQVRPLKKKKADISIRSDDKQLDKDKSLNNKSIEKVNKSVTIHEESSSDSIDMKLLFNEDSTDSEINVAGENVNDKEISEVLIPQKRTEGKTNILETSDVTSSANNVSILNVSKSKKNKRKSAQSEDTITMNDQEEENLGFYIDTTGAQTDINKSENDTSVKESAKKKKHKNDVSLSNNEEVKNDDGSNDAPLEVSYTNNKNMSKEDFNITQNDETELNTTAKLSAKKKKKNKKGLNNSQINNEGQNVNDDDTNDAPLEVSYTSNKNINKSKENLNITQTDDTELNTTAKESAKKKKKNKKGLNSAQIHIDEQNVDDTVPDNVAEKSVNTSGTSSNKKKKNKLSMSQVEEAVKEAPAEISLNHSIGSAKKQKKESISEIAAVEKQVVIEELETEEKTTKKRKRKPSANTSIEGTAKGGDVKILDTSQTLYDSVVTNQKKKRKINDEDDPGALTQVPDVAETVLTEEQVTSGGKKTKKANKTLQSLETLENGDESTKKSKKRKERDEDDGKKLSKVIKQNSFDNVHVPRLPANILKQLDDKPKNDIPKAKVISTSSFKVEESKKRKNKPSNYLEQSVHLNDSMEEQKRKSLIKKPKVLPFIPTASTSGFGFTTNFKVNVIPQEVQFVAQSSDVSNFKKDCLQKNRIKKLGTFEKYKRHRNIKISKF